MKTKKGVAIIIAIVCAVVVVGAVFFSKENSGITVIAENLRFSATNAKEITNSKFEEKYSFYDDDYYYYIFYLGRLDHVPLQDNASTYEYKGNNFSKEITATTTSTQTIETLVSYATDVCVEYSTTIDINNTVELGDAGAKQKLEMGFSQTVTNGITASSSESYKKAESYSYSVSDTTMFEFNAKTKKGFYRYVLFGDIDVFAVLIKDIATGDYYKETYEIIVSQYYSLDYSETSTFDDNNYGKLVFEVDENFLANLATPEKYIGDITLWQWTYDNTNEKTIDASYTYNDLDRFDFSNYEGFHDFRKYMLRRYTFVFNIKLTMKEVYEGYQLIKLCNSNGDVVASAGDNYSYRGGNKGGKGVEEFNFEVSGDKCTEQMYMSYGAWGKNSDDWVRYECHVVVTIKPTK